MDLSWMAWTWPTAVFFLAVLLSITAMGIWEKFSPGGGPRHGVFRIDTTRGDRLFVSWVSAGFIHLAWLAIFSTPLWGALFISVLWTIFVFRWV